MDKRTYMASARRELPERIATFFRTGPNAPLFEEVHAAASELQPLPTHTVRAFLLASNEFAQMIVREWEEAFGPPQHPKFGEYEIALKECVDARHASFSILDLLRRRWIHDRVAGSVATLGSIFKALDEDGRGYVLTHDFCGLLNAAHDHVVHGIEPAHTDNDIALVMSSTHRATMRIEDQYIRATTHCEQQVSAIRGILLSAGTIEDVLRAGISDIRPLHASLRKFPEVGVEWLSGGGADPFARRMDEQFKSAWALAREFKYTPEKQYSHTIVLYDPFRLGRINGPRTIFSAVPNELFCVTDDFSEITNGYKPAGTALGSLRYAGFLDGGHVHGVGGKHGNRHVLILDPDVATLRATKAKLLFSEDVRELTKNGETITLGLFDRDTAKVTFIDL